MRNYRFIYISLLPHPQVYPPPSPQKPPTHPVHSPLSPSYISTKDTAINLLRQGCCRRPTQRDPCLPLPQHPPPVHSSTLCESDLHRWTEGEGSQLRLQLCTSIIGCPSRWCRRAVCPELPSKHYRLSVEEVP